MDDIPRRPIVTIDGPAGAGKSTVSKRLAQRLGFELLDTGALYRAVALLSEAAGIPWQEGARLAEIARDLEIQFSMENGVNRIRVAGKDVTTAVRSPEISQGASQVSAHPLVRTALLGLQRSKGQKGGIVVEGRDVGTVVFPHAEVKFFLTASPEVRAQRRYDELVAKGEPVDYAATLAEIVERDQRDSTRDVAPLKPADDAVRLDCSTMDIEQVVAEMVEMVRTSGRK